MKALLVHLDVIPPGTHELLVLDRLLEGACPQWQSPVEDLRFLSRAAVAFRYPGESADEPTARQSLQIARRVRQRLLSLLPPE